MKHKNGSWIWLQTNGRVLTRTKNNHVQTVLNVSLDITQRKEAEKNATQNLEHIKYALDQSAIVAITDKSGMIQYVNDKFLEISHYSREELIGKTHRVINSKYHPREFFSQMWKTILSGKVWHGEIRNRTRDGTLYWVDTTVTPLLNEDRKPVQFIAIHYEVTQRKQLERQKDEFIGIASHELKTPVTSLKGYVQVMEKRFTKQGDLKSAGLMAKMDAQINKLNTLIQDLLDVTKIETGKLQFHADVFDLNELVLEIIEAMQLTTERHQILKRGTVNKLVYADRERIGQVLINLLSNAIKYSPNADKIIVRLIPEKDYVTVAVVDFGVGIAKEKQSHLFERFYRVTGTTENTFPGLGLGLYISAELIRRHRGRIWLDSKTGKGAAFYFTLPWGNHIQSTQLNSLIEKEIRHE
jgi:PAS domain S-box-containing protein